MKGRGKKAWDRELEKLGLKESFGVIIETAPARQIAVGYPQYAFYSIYVQRN